MDHFAHLRPTALPALLFLIWLPLWPIVRHRHSALFLTCASIATLPLIAGPAIAIALVAAIALGKLLTEACAAPLAGERPRRTAPTAWSPRFAIGLIAIHIAYLAVLAGPAPRAWSIIKDVREVDRVGVFVFFSGVGLTFFRLISYYFDRRRGVCQRLNWGDYLAYMLFFPQFRHGPIERADDFVPKLRAARANWKPRDLAAGFGRVAFGLATLVVGGVCVTAIAQHVIGAELGEAFRILLETPEKLTGWRFLLALHTPLLLLVFIESAFASVSLGVSRCFGVVGHENYDWVLLSRTPREVWKRWNITTFAWLRDYVYRESPRRRFPRVSMFIVFAYAGAIHGLQWRFVAWGVVAGLSMTLWAWIAERTPTPRGPLAAALGAAGRILTIHWCAWLAIILLDANHWGWLVLQRFAALLVGQ